MKLHPLLTLTAALLLATLADPRQAHAQGSFNFTFPSAPGTCPSLCPSFNIVGPVTFNISASSPNGASLYWAADGGENNSSSTALSSNGDGFNTLETVTIRRTDNQGFRFDSIHVRKLGTSPVSVAAYRSGSRIGNAQTVSPGNTATLSFAGVLSDEIRITSYRLQGTYFDSVKGVLPAPEVLTNEGISAAVEQIPKIVDSTVTVPYAGNTTLHSATVSITGNYTINQDVLSFTNTGPTMGNITGSFSPASGILTLTSAGGTATLAQWEVALRTVTYTNTSDTPNVAQRTVSFIVSNNLYSSLPATKVVSVIAVNDPPVLTVPAEFYVLRNQSNALNGITIADPDAGSANLTFSSNIGGATTEINGPAGAPFVVYYTPPANAPSTITGTFELSDHGNTGTGGERVVTTTATFYITSPSTVSDWVLY